jgi:hypothetical protein
MSRKQTLGSHISHVNRQIARHLNRSQPVPPGLAQALADLLKKAQRNRFGELQNARKRGELR